ncbi:tyrosine-type recombinase/integrase [Pseudogulbenkiania ferrooxidans]|uniref:Integrase family protein n=1 Tax=Pseudogulbenkiania ferrooxidans 2002 TaxID=279714 RepID=B9Z4X5_9NEIS|nr:tyrosine-type recombinase/integrase [Pseudogulbenkiania ferrooxidans]EEG08207.1 integrase family protein [Pseudogulbenkiania ferrooxidans 2002]
MERYLTPTELQQLLNAARRVNDPLAQRDYHVMAALSLSGCRIGEFSLITLGDAWDALKTGYLFIPRENRKGGKRDHKVFVTRPLRLHLVALLNMNDSQLASEPLVPGRFGQPLTVRNYQQRVAHWAKEAGLSIKVTPHFFRHTRAMNIMRSSEAHDPRGIVQNALGHNSIASTGIYTQPSHEDIENTLEAIDGHGGRRTTMGALRKGFERRAG